MADKVHRVEQMLGLERGIGFRTARVKTLQVVHVVETERFRLVGAGERTRRHIFELLDKPVLYDHDVHRASANKHIHANAVLQEGVAMEGVRASSGPKAIHADGGFVEVDGCAGLEKEVEPTVMFLTARVEHLES